MVTRFIAPKRPLSRCSASRQKGFRRFCGSFLSCNLNGRTVPLILSLAYSFPPSPVSYSERICRARLALRFVTVVVDQIPTTVFAVAPTTLFAPTPTAMEILTLPQSWQCSHQIEEDNDEPFTGSIEKAFAIVYPTAKSDSSPRIYEEQEGEDDYAWYYKHPERYVWRPRRSRLVKSRRQQKDKQFTMFDLLLDISRNSWTDGSVSETQGSTHSARWSLLTRSSSTGSTKVSDVGFPKF